jgi:hypothetical protein
MPIDVLHSLAATLAYRAAKVLPDATPGFAASTFAPSTRQPVHTSCELACVFQLDATRDFAGKKGRRIAA